MSITVAPSVKSATKENDKNRKTNARRSSMSADVTQDTDLETFDYDTSDSIEEDDEEEVVGKRERNSKMEIYPLTQLRLHLVESLGAALERVRA
jgi:hypothetical protein